MPDPLLDVRELETKFFLRKGVLTAVDRVSFQLHRKETLGIVGETGSGKSVLALSLMRLIPEPPGKITHGKVLYNGENLLQKSEREMRTFRGRKISMIFQEPMVALNPAYTIGEQVAEGFMVHEGLRRREAYDRAAEMLAKVGIQNVPERLKSYPHEFSGGMRQRVMIAIALSCNPDILIADEPTTALDVTIQAQILDLLRELLEHLGKALIFITHDLGVAAVLCDRIAVMYAGNIVELADQNSIFERPLHPYTQGLLRALPRRGVRRKLLDPIPGVVCNLLDPPSGCKFRPRCEHAMETCSSERPALRRVEGDRWVASHLYS
ncbi:MAG: ABC transporter ATP-binding protein [Candidatus Binatia bacterium]